ncbi:DHA2 family efflux MFS transporter permease subunit [Rhizorhabdus histidinilytica]|uniref:MFS transporter, DHA2 family, multidrug resistance protein n=1 Tax=Rhizorhabdus histidinilytica TaxID=439228 RepID=A0A1T5AKG1_9SPHN|nr:DHA2 family efflux MFS transporter permease subunit [Rhizorhabdus histidinilytica]SKB35267.1 MFS transporter, DHA2 family, multidrug resistance protein [Rhizorhabdus histidinilytica]
MTESETSQQRDVAVVPIAPIPKMIVTTAIMAATILVVLDQTIATVALPHMQAALGATPDTVTWVLTSYIMATAVGTPLTAWLTGRFGRRQVFLVCVLGFTVSSMLCGAATSLPMMVACRLAQGFFGAFLMPMSQAFLYDMNPPSLQVRAITMWGIGAMVGPIVGPVLGGYLTDAFDWRWVFFVNVPVGIVALAGVFFGLPQFPSVRRSFDHAGFIMIAIALCSLQLALDRGTQQDWLDSPEIIAEFGISIAAFWMLIFHLRRSRHPIISPGLFANPSFSGAMVLAFVLMPTIIASNALLPQLFVQLLGYPVATAGEMMLPRGIAMTVGIFLGGQFTRWMDGRLQVALGVCIVVASLYVQTGFNMEMDQHLIIWAGVLQGFGTGLSMTVLNFTAMSSAPLSHRTEAAALYSLSRNTGSSIMLAIFSGLLAHDVQVNHAELGARISSGGGMSLHLSRIWAGNSLDAPIAAVAEAEVNRQAMMIAYINDFWVMMWVVVALLPLVLLLRPERPPKGSGESLAALAD